MRADRRGAGVIPALFTVAAVMTLGLGAVAAEGDTSSLPSVPVGPPPGPPVLHAPAATTPIFENTGVWQAPPTMVSGTERYDRGEYIYTDYIFDDHGADAATGGAPGVPPEPRPPRSSLLFGPPSGDVVYPTDGDRYGYNAADLLELRIRPDADALRYRFTMTTMIEPDAAAIAIGIETDGTTTGSDWGHGLGDLGAPADHVLYTDGVDATLTDLADPTAPTAVAVVTDPDRNQIEVTIPRDVLDPTADDVWRHHAVTGIADGAGGFTEVQAQPSSDEPGGAGFVGDIPPVFNVAFRFEERGDEPMGMGDELGLQHPMYGSWREHGQAGALADRDISAFHADVDFGKLADGTVEDNVPRTGFMNRLFVSSLDLGEGVADERPWFLGPIQPYAIYVPESYDGSDPAGLMLVLHSLSASHNQFQAASPQTYIDLAEERGAIAMTPLARGPDGWYHHEAEVDVFEVWADVARNYRLDPDRVAITGYSMGGYGTFRYTTLYPDLFAKGFPVVGPPGENISPIVDPGLIDDAGGAYGAPPETDTTPLLDNVRNIPLLIWIGLADELVPAPGVIAHAQRLDLLGYRYYLDSFTADHFLLASIDDWSRGAAFLGDAAVDRDPSHVTYRVRPQTHVPELGLVHDRAYWIWDVAVADTDEDAGGLVDARSLAHGEGEPETEPVVGAGPDPLPYVREGQEWTAVPSITPENRLEMELTNVAELVVSLERAGLAVGDEPTVALTTDAPTSPRFVAGFPLPLRIVDADGDEVDFDRDGDEVTVTLDAGDHELTFLGAPAAPDPDGPDPAADPPLPATGGSLALVGLILIAAAGLSRRRSR